MNHSDPGTLPAIEELCSIVKCASRPVVFWIGGGASAWAGLPTWQNLAETFHREFSKLERTTYDRDAGFQLLQSDLPAFFSLLRRTSESRYFRLLVELLRHPGPPNGTYSRFITALRKLEPLMVVTTNVDDLLERSLQLQSLSPSNISTIHDMIVRREGFVAKLHGSISDIHSLVFTSEDYAGMMTRSDYLDALKRLFQGTSLVFIGYSLRDKYVLDEIAHASSLAAVFGIGPHFACLSDPTHDMPVSVRAIRYTPDPFREHRAPIQLIEEIGLHRSPSEPSSVAGTLPEHHTLVSAHMLSDIFTDGTNESSQKVVATRVDGSTSIRFYMGHGLLASELPLSHSTALHDLAVGLLCFDRVYAPLSALGRLHEVLGGALFTDLVRSDAVRFVRMRGTEVVIFPSSGPELVGELGTVNLPSSKPDGSELSVLDLITKQIKPRPGREAAANQLFELLQRKVLDPTSNDSSNVPDMVRNLLVRPSFRSMLGISGGTSVTSVPRWVMYPVMRLAQVVRLGIICRQLQLASIKFEFGSDKLAGPAFASAFGKETAGGMASYVVAGNFRTDLGSCIKRHPDLLRTLLMFRDSLEGQNLRRVVLANLTHADGAEVSSSINAGLNGVLPTNALETAREKFVRLCVGATPVKVPAIWHDADYGEKALTLWKQRSALEFRRTCSELKCSPYSPCPCGSGEKIKFCCGEVFGIQV